MRRRTGHTLKIALGIGLAILWACWRFWQKWHPHEYVGVTEHDAAITAWPYILPWGPQQIFVRGKKRSPGSTKGGVSLTRDDGINFVFDYNLTRSVDLSAGYSHSAYSVLNTVSFGVEVNIASWLRERHGE